MPKPSIIKSFQDHLRELEPIHWDYYYGQGRQLQNPFLANGNHTHFIEQYFKIAGKEMLLDNFPVKDLERPAHVTSTFFLGLIIIIKCNLVRLLSLDGKNAPGYDQLPFVWFLTTLFHDYAERLEGDGNYHAELKNIDDLIAKYQVEHNLLTRPIEGVSKILLDAIPNYYVLRHSDPILNMDHGRVDHGIHAGLYAFDSLVKNRITNKQRRAGELSWEDYLDDQYALACACVATHNIWVNQPTLKYLDHGLETLTKFEPYSLTEFPLPYVFSIVDTIDPVKYFCCQPNEPENISLEELLAGIGFTFDPDHIYIHNISIEPKKFQEYFKKIKKNLKGWLDHKIRHIHQGTIKITITSIP